ncbi:MAG TPA: FAD-dependent oxidoreductase [Acidimicrobiales bacterium]|nr:FAD-dependent oxidoreductase [Acidimicrobiales bacterium]
MTNERDVIVVGGGLAGLAAAATVADGGGSVLVLEAHLPGGRARTADRDGFTFNMGAHALYAGGAGMRALRALGVEPAGAPPPLERYLLRLGGRLHTLPTGPATLLRTTALGPRGKAQFGALLAHVPRTDARRLEGVSVEEWIASRALRPDVDAVVRALLRISTYASDFTTFAADAAVRQLQTATRGGVLYLHGGWAQLVAALAAKAEVRAHTAARRIEPAGGRVEVVTDDDRYLARAVVVALPTPGAAAAVLPEAPAWGPLGAAITAACLDAGVRGVPSPGYVLGADDPVYATTQSPPARQAPAGSAVVTAIRYGATDPDADRAVLEAYLAHAGARAEDVVTSRFLAHLTVCGAAPIAAAGGLSGRPPVRAADGLYVAGDWVGPEGLIGDAALSSGHHAGMAALEHATRQAGATV